MVYQARCMNQMNKMPMCVMPNMQSWSTVDFLNVFVMWTVMMVAMMIPSAVPMVLVFASINRKRQERQDPFVPTWNFLLGYLVSWVGFSVLATGAQWYLHSRALLCPLMISTTPLFSGIVLSLAGIFQFTPLKNTCLKHCQTPFHFIMTEWREGKLGAFLMGWQHGLFCTGCCWALMALLFVVGVMNLVWIAIVSIVVLLEKVAPQSLKLSPIVGFLLMGWGISMMLGKFVFN